MAEHIRRQGDSVEAEKSDADNSGPDFSGPGQDATVQ